jgi:P2 family phage contractile tail tube protein
MSNSILMMEAANIFVGDDNPNASNHMSIQTLKLPNLEESYVEHNAGGAAVGMEFETHMNKLEATFNLAGWTPDVMTKIGRWSVEVQRFTARGAIRDRRSGKVSTALARMWGRLAQANATDFRRGDLMGFEYAIKGIHHYELIVGGRQLIYFDYFENARIIGGWDVNSEINAALGVTGSEVQAPNGAEMGGMSISAGGIINA